MSLSTYAVNFPGGESVKEVYVRRRGIIKSILPNSTDPKRSASATDLSPASF